MELNEGTAGTGSHKTASESDEVAAPESLQLTDELRLLMSAPVTDNSSSFTALQAVQPIHSPDSAKLIAAPAPAPNVDDFKDSSHFLSNSGLIEQAAKFSVFTGDGAGNINDNNKSNSPEPSSCDSSASLQKPGKSEPGGTESPQPFVSDPTVENRSIKGKDREKVKGSTKESRTAAKESSDDAEKLPYVHVEARWGQATDRHISAERATREKINERMKILRDLVPVGSKIKGEVLVLDETISYVHSLHRQVEFLSMKLAAVNPRIDFNLDSRFPAEIWIFLIANLAIEIISAVFDQLASVRKPGFALAAMLMALVGLFGCIIEIAYKGRKEKGRWRWDSPTTYRHFCNFADIFGLASAILQTITAIVAYVLYRRHSDNPIKLSFWPILFAIALLCSQFLKDRSRTASRLYHAAHSA